MSEQPTRAEIEALIAKHTPAPCAIVEPHVHSDDCAGCYHQEMWPCPTLRLARHALALEGDLAALQADLAQAKSEAATLVEECNRLRANGVAAEARAAEWQAVAEQTGRELRVRGEILAAAIERADAAEAERGRLWGELTDEREASALYLRVIGRSSDEQERLRQAIRDIRSNAHPISEIRLLCDTALAATPKGAPDA